MASIVHIADGLDLALSVVVPCYNEDAGIDELYRRVSTACEQQGQTYEIVLINDGSSDATCARIFALADADHHVVGIDLARNYWAR